MYSHNLLLERMQRAIVDGIAVFSATLIAVWIRHGIWWSSDATPWLAYLFPAVLAAALTVIALHLAGSYRRPHSVVPARILVGALGFATVITLTMSYFYRGASYSRMTVLIFLPLAALLVIGMRFGYGRYVTALAKARAAVRRVVIVGHTPSGTRLAKALAKRPMYYDLVGFVDDSRDVAGNGSRAEVLGDVSTLSRIVDDLAIDEVLICLPGEPDQVMDVIGVCIRSEVTWKFMPNMYGLRMDRISVDDIDGIPLIGPHSTRLVGFSWLQKRGFDIAVSALALILLSPILLAAALAVRFSSRGPVLYKQTRVGINGRPFTMLKFRSMKTGNSTAIHSDYTREWIYGRTSSPNGNGNGAGPTEAPEVNKITNDPRITVVGRFLRATSIDELPQFWNVFRGDMSVVGPRPALPYEVDRYTEWHKRRLAAPPGITGAWQVSGRNNLSFEEMVALDVNYIENWSFESDVKIVLRTVPAVLKFGGK